LVACGLCIRLTPGLEPRQGALQARLTVLSAKGRFPRQLRQTDTASSFFERFFWKECGLGE
jgi:hypothetical protein